MLAAYTELKNAEKVKQQIIKKDLFHPDYLAVKEMDYIYFPLKKRAKISKAKVVNTKFEFPQKKTPPTVDELLKNKLTAKQMKILPRSLEVVGDIMIIEIPEELEKKEKLIAEAYLKTNKHITTVAKKKDVHGGIYRTRKIKILAGKRNKETVHYENGVKIKLHLEKTYFSARSGNERLRIARQIKKNEEVLVMFSGAAPFPLVLAKNSPAKLIYGIELNSSAHNYAVGNLNLNNFNNKINLIPGDVRVILPKLKKKFDRIIMPLPKSSEDFLDAALKKAKKGAIIHLYAFLNEKDINRHAQKIKQICKEQKRSIKVLRKIKCGQFSPGVFRVCFDLKVLK